MRRILALPYPRPVSGWGFRFSARAALAALLVLAAVAPAHAADVSVRLRIAAGGYAGAVKECAVAVPSGSNGRVVLQRAVAQRCISSFQTSDGGAYVTCIDPGAAPVCEIADGLVAFWAVYEDGRASQTGINGFSAASGKSLAFAYTNFATCFATFPDCPL